LKNNQNNVNLAGFFENEAMEKIFAQTYETFNEGFGYDVATFYWADYMQRSIDRPIARGG